MITVIVPTLNEVQNIEPLARRIAAAVAGPLEVIFVDDGSTDGTAEKILLLQADLPVRLIQREPRCVGLATAVIEGVRATEADLVVVMDADLSHPPENIPELIRPLLSGDADMVIGSRYVEGGMTPGWPVWRKIMSRAAAALAYPLTHVHDSMCGFFAISRDRLLELAPATPGFKIAFEVIAHGGRALRVVEVPIVFRDRSYGTSKMSFGVALVFFLRWLAAISRLRDRRRGGFYRPQLPGQRNEQQHRGEEHVAVCLSGQTQWERQGE
ncbi:MAG: polyprenol monophosphomannose synthase [Chthoniobacterales bacterium]